MGDRAICERYLNPEACLRGIERLTTAVSLDYNNHRRALERREPMSTLGTGTATPDRRALFGGTAIDHSGVSGRTQRATHRSSVPAPAPLSGSNSRSPQDTVA